MQTNQDLPGSLDGLLKRDESRNKAIYINLDDVVTFLTKNARSLFWNCCSPALFTSEVKDEPPVSMDEVEALFFVCDVYF